MPEPVTDPRAGELLRRHQELFGGSELPVPVESIAEDLVGLRIAESDTLPVSGLLLPKQREIRLNAEEIRQSAGRRRRFTVAHELGHWICQVLEGHSAPICCRGADLAASLGAAGAGHAPPSPDRRLEREANVFAAELLMPEDVVRQAWAKAPDVDGCATRFDVGPTAMQWRLYSLGLVEGAPG